MSKIILNIVEPGTPPSPTPIDPGTNPTVPNTGLFTHGIGGPEATIITISIVAILAIVAATVLYYKKKHSKETKEHKASKSNKLANALAIAKAKKKVSIPLAALALVISLGTLATLLVSAGKSNTNAVEGTEDRLTVKESDQEFTIEVGDEPVFAVLPVELTVEEATEAGYTLTAYADSTDLVSAEDDSRVIPMVAADEGELVALADNTYGLSLVKPESQDDELYASLSTDADAPTVLKSIDDYTETPAEDKTTIYYGFYITPDTPYGTYEGSDINYSAVANEIPAIVTFDGRGLYFNDNEEQTENRVKYVVTEVANYDKYSHTPNIANNGKQEGNYESNLNTNDVITVPDAVKFHVKLTYGGESASYDWVSFWSGNHPEYRASNSDDLATAVQSCGDSIVTNGKFGGGNHTSPDNTVECDVATDDSSITFSFKSDSDGYGDGYGYYAIVAGYDADGNLVGEPTYVNENMPVVGQYDIPSSNLSYNFLGWDENAEATVPTYTTEDDIKKELSLTPGETVTLYAIWQSTFSISYNGNGADTTTNMDNVKQYTTDLTSTDKQVDLLASNFTKEGYGFVGWSTDANAWDNLVDADPANDPTIYGPNQTITINEDLIAEAGENRRLVLNAVWAPAETTASGDPVSLQDWQGCSSLTATTYDTETSTLSVGKNTITALTDNRDGNIYTVARLADGNCWMTENLRLDNSTANESTTSEFTTANTNNPSLPLTNNYAEQTTSNRLSVSSNNWCADDNSAPCYNQSIINTDNITNPATSPSFNQDFTSAAHEGFSASINSYSTYYNWYSATAGNGKQETSSNVTVAGDICPAGWHLPYGGSQTSEKGGNTSGGFYYLNQQMGGNTSATGSNNWRSFPNNFVYSSYWSGSSATNRGGSGRYWSSTAGYTGNAYYLYFDSSFVFPAGSYYKSLGYSVRCVVSQ